MTSKSRRLTNLLNKARKMHFFGNQNKEFCTIGFAYQYPQYIDWGLTGPVEKEIYRAINDLLEELYIEDKPLTARQREILEL